MKSKLQFLLFLISFTFSAAFAQSLLLDESFETWLPTGWTKTESSMFGWEYTSSTSYTGSRCAHHEDASSSDDWLVSPQISISDSTLLIFYEKNSDFSFYNYSGVYISSGSADPTSGDFVEIYESNVSLPDFTQTVLDLSAFIDSSIYIGFKYVGEFFDHEWYIDDVKVFETGNYGIDASLISDTYSIAENDTSKFLIQLSSLGKLTETYNFSITGANALWSYGYKDKADAGYILSLGLDSLEVDSIYIEIAPPPSLSNRETDTVQFIFTSQSDVSIADTLEIHITGYPVYQSLTEGFENNRPPDDWALYELGDNSGWKFRLYPHTGNYAVTHWDDNVVTLCNDWIVSPKIFLSDSAILSFFEKNSNMSWYDYSGVLISEGNGNPKSGDFVELYESSTYIENYKQKNINLSDYVGKNVYIAFNYQGDYAHDWYIDDIEVRLVENYDFDLKNLGNNQTINPDSCYYYEIQIDNSGLMNDTIQLSMANENWTYEILKNEDSIQISEIIIPSFTSDTFLIKVTVPSNDQLTFGEKDSALLIGFSNGNSSISDTISLVTKANTPVRIFPKTDNFEQFLPELWTDGYGILGSPSSIHYNLTSFWYQDDFGNSGDNLSARINIYGSATKGWLFTPKIDLGNGSSNYCLYFDMILKDFNNTDPGIFGEDDTVSVIISTDAGSTWSRENKLMEYNNSVAINDAGEKVLVNLGNYSGLVKIGFYAESTVSNEDNDFFIDNVTIFVPDSAELASSIPANSGSLSNVGDAISITFDKAISIGDSSLITLTGASSGTVSGLTLQLQGNNTTILIQHPNLDNGETYTVNIGTGAVVDQYTVPNKAAEFSFSTLATNMINREAALTKVFPVPAKGKLFIQSEKYIKKVSITNIVGNQLDTYIVADDNFEINLDSYSSGYYLLRIETKNSTFLKQFIVE